MATLTTSTQSACARALKESFENRTLGQRPSCCTRTGVRWACSLIFRRDGDDDAGEHPDASRRSRWTTEDPWSLKAEQRPSVNPDARFEAKLAADEQLMLRWDIEDETLPVDALTAMVDC